MPEPGRRRAIAVLALWLVVWAAAILIALHALGGEALAGSLPAALFLAIWCAAALIALARAARRLAALVTGRRSPPRPPGPRHRWRDGMTDAERPPRSGDPAPPPPGPPAP